MSYVKEFLRLTICIALCFGAAALGAYFTSWNVHGWYQDSLLKPAWTPSGRLISQVWTVLFAMMAVSVWMVSRRRDFRDILTPLSFFALQLSLNVLWSFFFFGIRSPGIALVDLLALMVALLLTIRSFYTFSKPAAAILVPYLCWLIFAGLLNFEIWRIN